MKKLLFVLFLSSLILLVPSCNRQTGTTAGAARTDLNMAVTEAFTTLDPHYITRIVDSLIVNQIYESLFLVEDDQSLTPQLAERFTVSADGLVYTFHLRRGVTFCNGDQFTADDAVFSLERAIESPVLFAQTELIESVRKIDDYTVEVRARSVSALFATYVGSLAMVNHRFVQSVGDLLEVACGTGAYVFDSQRRNISITLAANENHWRGAPPIKTLNWTVYGNAAAALISFESGELDIIGVPSANWDTIVAQNQWTTELYPMNHTTYIMMNHEIPPFNDVRVRQAISHAINRDDMVILAFDGLASPALTMGNPELVFGYAQNFTSFDYNPQRARQLLAEAGYPSGLELPPILTLGGSYFENVAVVLQDALRNVGITTRVELRESATYVGSVLMGDYAIGVMGVQLFPDADAHRVIYHSNAINSSLNAARYRNPVVDELFEVGLATIDVPARLRVYAELIEILQRDAVYAPVFFRLVPMAHDRNLNYVHRSTASVLYRENSWRN
ncbi:MAG: ABC transporter substrate-binding protein [Treponema sp.]|nr:ABC transporter substrate-binding protein [Treponema sp.]